MAKITRQISIWILILLLITGCVNKQVEPPQEENYKSVYPKAVNKYTIDVVFYPEQLKLQAKQRVEYINNEEVPLKEIYFHLYPNSFKDKETAPFLFDDFKRAYPQGFKPGSIDMKSLAVKDSTASYQLEGFGDTIMKIELSKELKPQEWISIDMEYEVVVPPAGERFGYGEDAFNFGNWYPVAAVYDESGWNLDPYYAIGDPFYSDVSNYHVTIEAPMDFKVAASGNILREEILEDKKIWEIEAKLMRDFAWVSSKAFEVVERDVEGILLKMYFIKDDFLSDEIVDFTTQVGEDALKTFNSIYGKYPYNQYSVVQTNFPSGMEYPGIVFIGKQFYDITWQDYLEIVIVHETAHQWWYGVVGNDQIDEAWLDESLATYSEVVYISEMYGEKAGEAYHKYFNQEEYEEAKKGIYDKTVIKPLYEFEGWEDYGPLVYNKGAIFLNEIAKAYGKEKLYSIFREYYAENQFKNATSEDFKQVSERVTGKDLEEMFNEWLLTP